MSAWTDLHANVRTRTSKCYEMNSLFVSADDHVLLVDPGVLPSELDELAAAAQGVSPKFDRVSLALSHPHWDHVLGMPWFPGATTFAHVGFGDELLRDEAAIRTSATAGLAAHGETLPHEFQAYVPGLAARGAVERGRRACMGRGGGARELAPRGFARELGLRDACARVRNG